MLFDYLSFFRTVITVLSAFSCTTALAYDIISALPETPIIPEDNPQTEAKIALGKQLFFDPRLSYSGQFSCNSCHNLMSGGDDDGAVGRISNHKLKRSAPSVWNAAYMSTLYWDARAKSLESQAIDHLLDPNVMNMGSAATLTARLSQIPGYQTNFKAAFGNDVISIDNIGRAIANFERTLKTPNSDFDRFKRGDKSALSSPAKRGFDAFIEIGCMSCHFGVNFAGPAPGPAFKMGDAFYELFPNYLGTIYDEKYDLISDLGTYHVSLQADQTYMWRVPSMRNIALTAPYLQNGSVKTLTEAVKVMGLTQLKKQLTDQEISDVVAFLQSLTGEFPDISMPRLPETPGQSLLP